MVKNILRVQNFGNSIRRGKYIGLSFQNKTIQKNI